MKTETVRTIMRYKVDRGKGVLPDNGGVVEVVALILQTSLEGPGEHFAFCLSKADAYVLAHELQLAAQDAQKS